MADVEVAGAVKVLVDVQARLHDVARGARIDGEAHPPVESATVHKTNRVRVHRVEPIHAVRGQRRVHAATVLDHDKGIGREAQAYHGYHCCCKLLHAILFKPFYK